MFDGRRAVGVKIGRLLRRRATREENGEGQATGRESRGLIVVALLRQKDAKSCTSFQERTTTVDRRHEQHTRLRWVDSRHRTYKAGVVHVVDADGPE